MQDGTYEGTTKSAVLYEAPSGAMMAVVDVDVQGQTVKAWITLVQKDGTVSERGLKNMQEVMGIQGWDWASFENPHSFAGHPCEVIMATEPDQNGDPKQKVKWLNVLGGGAIKLADPKAMAAKYAAKFRAIAGGSTMAQLPAAKPASAQVAPPRLHNQGTSTGDECWAALREKMAGKDEIMIEAAWFRLFDKFGRSGPEQMTANDWAKSMALIQSMKPTAAPEPPPPVAPAVDEDNIPF